MFKNLQDSEPVPLAPGLLTDAETVICERNATDRGHRLPEFTSFVVHCPRLSN